MGHPVRPCPSRDHALTTGLVQAPPVQEKTKTAPEPPCAPGAPAAIVQPLADTAEPKASPELVTPPGRTSVPLEQSAGLCPKQLNR